jgi:hypothetical protein
MVYKISATDVLEDERPKDEHEQRGAGRVQG